VQHARRVDRRRQGPLAHPSGSLASRTRPERSPCPGKLATTRLRIRSTWRAACADGDRVILPIRKDMHRDEIDRRRDLTVPKPESHTSA
jgi:hypothetical protein